MKKSMREKIEDRFRRIQQDKIERDRLRYSKDYQPEVEGYLPDRK